MEYKAYIMVHLVRRIQNQVVPVVGKKLAFNYLRIINIDLTFGVGA